MTANTTRAATAALLIALIAMLAACGGSSADESSPGEKSTVASTVTSQETSLPLGSGQEELKAGTHVLDLVARDQVGVGPGPAHMPRIQITLPDGWFNYKGVAVGKGRKFRPKTFVFFWDVAEVYPRPCKWAFKSMIDPGRDVEGLASALAKQPLRNATAPTDTEFAGFRAKYLELSVPTNIDFDDCDEGFFESWTANGWASDRYQQTPGQVDRIWILDVNGERLVIDASYLPEATPQDRTELERVVDSIRFVD